MYFRKSFPSSLALPILFIINITFAFGASVLQDNNNIDVGFNHAETSPSFLPFVPPGTLEDSLTFAFASSVGNKESPVEAEATRQSQGSSIAASGGLVDFFNGLLTGFSLALQGGVAGATSLVNGFGDAANYTFNGLLAGYNSSAQGLIQGASSLVGNNSVARPT